MEDLFAGKAAGFDDHYASPRGRVRLDLVLERLRHRLPPPPAAILDAGGGTGAFAIPLAAAGYQVTVLDASTEWLDRARTKAVTAGVHLRLVQARLEDLASCDVGQYDAVLCHALLMYVADPEGLLIALRSAAREHAVLSLLDKNRDGLALRPALGGDFIEAQRLLTERTSKGRLGVENRAHSIDEWREMLTAADWQLEEWSGIRLFSDFVPDDLGPEEYAALLALERSAGTRDPYRQVARLVHFIASAGA